jgi:polyisoprenoid-binding protein YceI
MIRRALLIAASLLVGAQLPAQAEPVAYAFDPDFTRVHWEVRHFGTSTQRGRFDRLRGSVTLDRTAQSGDIGIVIDTASVSSGVAPLDAMLRGSGFLASTDFPEAYFVARQFRFDGERLIEAHGEFTLRGVSRPLTLKAIGFGCRSDAARGEVCGGDFEALLLRSDFGASYGLPFIGNEVRLVIQVEGVRAVP